MRTKRLQNRMTTGRWTLPVVIFVCALYWALTSFLLPDLAGEESGYPLWQTACSYLPEWGERIISGLLYAIIGYFLIELNNRFTIIRIRASIQTSIYFLLITAYPRMHTLYAGDIASIAFLISIFFLFKSYQQTQPTGDLFHSFLFMGAGSILFPQLTFFIPLWLFTAYRFQSLTLRSFFATLVGWSIPYWFLFGHAFFYNQMDLFYQPFIELATFKPFFNLEQLRPEEFIMLGFLLIMVIISAIHCSIASYEDKIRTRSYLLFLINLTFYIFIFIFLQPAHCMNLLPLLMISASILIGHLFALTNSRISNIFFICSMVIFIFLSGFNLWMLL